jgi:hypothetical protein
LQRQGAVRAPAGRLSAAWLKAKPPRLIKGRKASEIILEERDSSR